MFLGTTPLNAPSGLSAQAASESAIDLVWTDNSTDETGFEIWRSDDGGSTYALVTTTAANAVTYSDTGLTGNTLYYYKVRAAVGSAFTDPVSAATFLTGPLYLSFKVKVAANEIAAFPSNFSNQFLQWVDPYSGTTVAINYRSDTNQWVYAIGGSAALFDQALVADTYTQFDLKVDYDAVPGQTTLSVKVDGVDGTDATVFYGVCPRQLVLGATSNLGSGLQNRTYDDVKFGLSAGGTDYLDANFASTIVPPFDSTVGAGTIEIVSGAMHTTATPPAQAEALFGVPLA